MANEKSNLLEHNGSNASQSPASSDNSSTKKRNSTSAGVDANGNPKPVKRRAAKACAACRARKVRCDVMQRYHITADGEVTCSNCTMDGIKCVIEESKRRKWVLEAASGLFSLTLSRKHLNGTQTAAPATTPQPNPNGAARTWGNGIVNPSDITNLEARRWSGSSAISNDLDGDEFTGSHVPHPICKFWRSGRVWYELTCRRPKCEQSDQQGRVPETGQLRPVSLW